MINEGSSMETIIVKRDNDRDIKFIGKKIARGGIDNEKI